LELFINRKVPNFVEKVETFGFNTRLFSVDFAQIPGRE